MVRKGLYNREELANVILTAVAAKGTSMTRLEICRAIGRAKSPHILSVIEWLNATEWLTVTQGSNKKGLMVLHYQLGKKYREQQDQFKQRNLFDIDKPGEAQ